MKYLLVLLVVLFAIWLWRRNREDEVNERAQNAQAERERLQRQRPSPAAPTDMVACKVCGVHLPLTDAVAGPHGPYCSEAHRRSGEG